jgi:hypothetical protein
MTLILLICLMSLYFLDIWKSIYLSYKACVHSYVILADKNKVPCLGIDSIKINLGGRIVILHDVLHVSNIRSPLITVRCFQCLHGCSFVRDNTGYFLAFPKFFLQVDDSSDCIINGSHATNLSLETDFDSRLVGYILAVSDITRFRESCRPMKTNSSYKKTTTQQHTPLVSSDSPTSGINNPDTSPPLSTITADNTKDISDSETLTIPSHLRAQIKTL